MATFDPKRFDEAMKQAPQALYDRLRSRLDKYTLWFATNKMARQATTNMDRRTGALARSFNRTAQGKNMGDVRWTIYTTSKYARIHEFGGDVTPKSKQYLSVPLDAAMTKTGRTRGSAPSYGYEKTFVAEVNGKPIVFRRTGKKRPAGWKPGQPDPTIQALFLLVKKVTLAPRLGFFATWDKEKPGWAAEVAKAVDEALDGLGGGRV